MNKSRRDFIKKLPLAMSIPFSLGGIHMQLMGQNSLTRLASAAFDDEPQDEAPRVLVVLQMHGGNDGLNCCIPIKNYADYYNMRPNIAIPAANSLRKYIPVDSTLPEDQQIGFHPDMIGMKSLYDQGRMTVVQGVSYKNNNGSHFRGRDISFMGGSYKDYLPSGWLGRYLQGEYDEPYPDDFPIFSDDPNKEMLDPLAIEMGSDISLIFHQKDSIPTSFSIDPSRFKDEGPNLNNIVGFDDITLDNRGFPPGSLDGTIYSQELNWILGLEKKTEDYTKRLNEVYAASAPTTITYPTTYPFNASGQSSNSISKSLQVIAQLLGSRKKCKTRVFLVKIGGFDTHADQVVVGDTTMGNHARLMYYISTAMKAFQDDLRARGIEDRVLTVTTTEFGRRVKSNGSYGTDHGTAAPLFIFGKGVQPGVIGNAYETTTSNNLAMQQDYRNVYANVMYDWMLTNDNEATKKAKLKLIFPGIVYDGTPDDTEFLFTALPVAQSGRITGVESFVSSRFSLDECYPNPAKDETTFTFKVNSAYNVSINLFGIDGKKVKTLVDGVYAPGEHKVVVDLTGFQTGNYVYELQAGFFKESKNLVIVK